MFFLPFVILGFVLAVFSLLLFLNLDFFSSLLFYFSNREIFAKHGVIDIILYYLLKILLFYFSQYLILQSSRNAFFIMM